MLDINTLDELERWIKAIIHRELVRMLTGDLNLRKKETIEELQDATRSLINKLDRTTNDGK